MEERLKKLEETKYFDVMGQITYWFRIRTNFDFSVIIGIVCIGLYFFFNIDYFIFRNSKF
jgi:hypothetical protein